MKLEDMLQGIEGATVRGDASVEIRDVAYDSRRVEPGALFFALPGEHVDGADFVVEALDRGARAVVSRRDPGELRGHTHVQVRDVREAMGRMSDRFFGHPSRELALVGVTGTNGKTTFTYLVESVLTRAGFRTGVVGTVSHRYAGRTVPAAHTTPESADLQRLLRRMRDAGCTHALLEVSSQGLDFRRVDACSFALCVFTMLGRDHLDHHQTMERYFASKARLFTEHLARSHARQPAAIVNRDDPYGRRLLELWQGRCVTVGRDRQADVRLRAFTAGCDGIRMDVDTPAGALRLRSELLSEVNTGNVLLAVGASRELDLGPEAIAAGIEALTCVPGRLEKVDAGQPFLAVVDYAHTPDALEKVVGGLRSLTTGRLVTVFGCGGDRDRGKRPLMGEAAGCASDIVIVTSDNPRSEPPGSILRDILPGLEAAGVAGRTPEELRRLPHGERAYCQVEDRGEAIGLAVRLARAGDTVLLAGKGHEEVQIIGDRRVPFRDRDVMLAALGALEPEGERRG